MSNTNSKFHFAWLILIMMALNILFAFMAFKSKAQLVAEGKWISWYTEMKGRFL